MWISKLHLKEKSVRENNFHILNISPYYITFVSLTWTLLTSTLSSHFFSHYLTLYSMSYPHSPSLTCYYITLSLSSSHNKPSKIFIIYNIKQLRPFRNRNLFWSLSFGSGLRFLRRFKFFIILLFRRFLKIC